MPPITGASTSTFTNSGGYLLSGNGSYAVWRGSSAPSYRQCRTLVQTQGSTSSIQITSSLDLCVRTGAGRTAYVKITSVSSDGSTAQAQATIWGQPSHAPPPAQASAVRWHGPIAINSSGIELDDVPPITGASTSTFTNSGGYLLSGNGSYAVWRGSSAPSYRQCHTLVQTQGSTSSIQITSSLDLCVRTGAGRTAYVKITSVSSDGSTAQAQATIWNQ